MAFLIAYSAVCFLYHAGLFKFSLKSGEHSDLDALNANAFSFWVALHPSTSELILLCLDCNTDSGTGVSVTRQDVK